MKDLEIISCKDCKFYIEKHINKSNVLCFCKYQRNEFKGAESQLSSDVSCFKKKK